MWKIIKGSISRYDTQNCRVDSNIIDPNWKQIESLIDKLDGDIHSEMDMEGSNARVMTIGGGAEFYVLTVIGEDFGPYELLGPDKIDEINVIIVGGVETHIPRRFLATKTQILRAAEFFYHQGELTPDLDWYLD